mmetsp:Transcript_22088/g.57660  ORF Transcript_22088/g.57660 Transcript_22088/m.57660 type:complete len:412 (+) Transcript_22088:114-1349(+)
MCRRPAGAALAPLVGALLLLPYRLTGLKIADNDHFVDAEETPDDGEVLQALPSVTNDGTLEPDPTDREACMRGRLLSTGKRYADHPDRLASLRENCGPCFMNQHDAPVLFIKESNEGMGSRVQELLTAMAVAHRNGMNFGGMVSRGVCHKAHGASVVRAARALLKLPHGNDIFTEEPPIFHAVYRGVQNLEENFARGSFRGPDFQSGANVLVQLRCISCELDGPEWNHSEYQQYWNPPFMKALRESAVGLYSQPLVYSSNVPAVAVHVRRGDVSQNDTRRHTPDSWYFKLVSRIRKTMPDADVHVFSSLEGKHEDSEFDEYRKRGMTVHLDETDIAKPWAQLARADVLVMAKSSFSHVPALLSNGCVLYEEYWHRPMQNWVVVNPGEHGQPSYDDAKLEECLQKVLVLYDF